MKVYPIFLAVQPTSSVTRDVRDALDEFPTPQSAASYLFQTKPASTLSRNWDLVVVVDTIAYRYSIDGGVRFIPIKPQAWRTMKRENLNWRYPKIGSTAYSIEEITKKAIQVSWPMKYSLYPESAQNFCYSLFESIRLPTIPPKPTQLITVLPGDLIRGLNYIPSPASTLFNRSKFAVVLTVLYFRDLVTVSCPNFLLNLASKRVFMPAKQLELNIRWAIKLVKAGSFACLFLAGIGVKLMVLFLVLVLGRDFGKASRGLKGLADEVRYFNGLDGVVWTRDPRDDVLYTKD